MKIEWTDKKPEFDGKYLYRFDKNSPVLLLELYTEYDAPDCPLMVLKYDYEVADLQGQWSNTIE